MRVARDLRDAGFIGIQSEFFEDPESHKAREIDVVGYQHLPEPGAGSPSEKQVHFAIVVECRVSKDKPFVLFTTKREGITSKTLAQQTASSPTGEKLLALVAQSPELRSAQTFVVPERIGYDLKTAHEKDDKDERNRAYDAVRSVIQATRSILDRLEALSSGPAFGWPIVVVDGSLVECWLGDDGEARLQSTRSGLLAWRNPLLGFHSWVRVVQNEAFADFAQQAKPDAMTFLAACRAARG